MIETTVSQIPRRYVVGLLTELRFGIEVGAASVPATVNGPPTECTAQDVNESASTICMHSTGLN